MAEASGPRRRLESFGERAARHRAAAGVANVLALVIAQAKLAAEETDSIDVPLFLGAVAGKAFAVMHDKQGDTRLVLELQEGTLSPSQA